MFISVCIPSPSLHRYELPFSVPTWRRLDGSSPGYPQLPQDDPLALQAVKVSWALGVHQGCDKFTKGLMAGLDMDERYIFIAGLIVYKTRHCN